MGWKNVKEHYRIKHHVHVTREGICIGSPYIHNIMVIDGSGKIAKRYDGSGSNEELRRYQAEMDADPEKLRDLVLSPDSFALAFTVYTYEGGDVLEKRCEAYGWPNVTHDGAMMYENRFSRDKAKVVRWAKENAEAGIRLWKRRIEEIEEQISRCRSELAEDEANLAKLQADYPEEDWVVDCTNPECGWTGLRSECYALGEIEPLCPVCKDTTEPAQVEPDGSV